MNTLGADDNLGADEETYQVVLNEEGQYSIWRIDSAPPAGWMSAGIEGSKAKCLQYIDQTWIDMKPASSDDRRER